MKQILIKSLKLRYFKGIREFEIADFNHGISIYGDNATGKTTVFDAFNWLMFGKDSLNSAMFELKTLQESGEPLHNLEHSVEGVLEADGKQIQLKKIYREKYVKRRGEAKRSFSGHTVDHFVDDVPCQQKEYNAVINTLCNEDNFKLLTNARYFNEVLHWSDRRRLLLDVTGDVPDADVIAANEDLADLPDILGKRNIDQHKKVISAKMTEINGQLEKIPVRIDERHQMIVELELPIDEIEKKITELSGKRTQAEKDVADAKAGGGVPEKERRLAVLEGDAQKLQNALDQKISERQSKQRKELAALESKAIQAGAETEKAQTKSFNQADMKSSKQETIKNLTKKQDDLRKRWMDRDAQNFVPPAVQETCPACGQPLPADKIEETLKQAEKVFNKTKAEALAEIGKEGKELGEKIKGLEAEVATLTGEIKASEKLVTDCVKAADAAIKEYDDLKAAHQEIDDNPPEKDPKLDELLADIDILKMEINSAKSDNYEAVMAAEGVLDSTKADLEYFEKRKLKHLDNEKTRKRILELEAEEKKLSAELERLEGELFTIETFIRTKVKMLESKIREKFKYASFRMFTENINGGLEECCDTTFEGVPYNSMNNGARINVGLDICNTLSNHYGISLPLFIDNAEAVTALFESDAQQIRLYVSEKDKVLRFENN